MTDGRLRHTKPPRAGGWNCSQPCQTKACMRVWDTHKKTAKVSLQGPHALLVKHIAQSELVTSCMEGAGIRLANLAHVALIFLPGGGRTGQEHTRTAVERHGNKAKNTQFMRAECGYQGG